MKYVTVTAYLLLLFTCAPVHADDDWWFDVEVILFDRNLSIDDLNEKFEEQGSLAPTVASMDLIDNYLRPDISALKQGLPRCDAPPTPLWIPKPSLEQILATHTRWQAEQGFVADAAQPSTDKLNEDPSLPAASAAKTVDQMDLAQRLGPPTDDKQTTPPVTAEAIAGYWVAFSGINDYAPVSVPDFHYCEQPQPWLTYEQGQWQTHFPDNTLPAPENVPEFLEGRDWPRSPVAHLLPYDKLELTDLSRQIRQTRGLKRLLHVAWRQPVKFGQDNAEAVRLIAGNNYGTEFDISGKPIGEEEPTAEIVTPDNDVHSITNDDFFTQLNTVLNQGDPIPFSEMMALNQPESIMQPGSLAGAKEGNNLAIWQLDGYLKVYLKYINRVPYLHIDSEIQYRQPIVDKEQSADGSEVPVLQLTSVPFHQVRRVISKQVHYFDHPLFGMVVEIRRYKRPQGD
ncbi:CsiV family protein [Alteromonas sp. 14N.309.X.WAT.G.H12]|uniref:CsiV family protein n=1 Tax=Alteromonas sp. 14N.309.X.WAT.G.H12 TaxID=3120824 RepID=UPI002FD34947